MYLSTAAFIFAACLIRIRQKTSVIKTITIPENSSELFGLHLR